MDLNTDTSLVVDISDALSEKDKVKFTVHTKVTMSHMRLYGLPTALSDYLNGVSEV